MAEETDISARLASRATEFSQEIFNALNKGCLKPADLGSFCAALNVATKLHVISEFLRSLPPYWIELDIEQLCHKILHSLDVISRLTTGPTRSSPFKRTYFTDAETKLVYFFKTQTKKSQEVASDCISLIDKLTKGEDDVKGLPKGVTQNLDTPDTSLDSLNNEAFNALQSIADQPSSPSDDDQLLCRGGFCHIIDQQIYAIIPLSFKDGQGLFRLNQSQVLRQIFQAGDGEPLKRVLRHYSLEPKDKVTLSYALARSFWKYYNSELLMRTKWTSDNIWFMPEEGNRGNNEQMPLCAYLSFPSGNYGVIDPGIPDKSQLTHKYPQIFDMGVLLLEIGLSKPFQTLSRQNQVSQANFNHKRALDELDELEKMNRDGFMSNKKYFDGVVKFCLKSEGIIPSSGQQKLNGKEDIIIRRRFHENVVRPLAWLAKKGFRAQAEKINYVNKKLHSPPRGISHDEPRKLEPEAKFHSATVVPQMWLSNLKRISELVEHKRRECGVTAEIRVAILDTGLDREFPSFQAKSRMMKSIIEERDFVNPDALTMTDTFGHGTLMARLIMECAPGAGIMVARVAKNTDDLESSRENIKKAILWAGQTGKADIIFMSFGFPYDDPGMREAIEKVQKDRQEDIIFLASAGNSSTDDESFPARHPAVISVFATNCNGIFLQSNARSSTNGAAVLGTFGDDIPSSIKEEFSNTYPKVCESGSSVATAIMAGISATMLIYTTMLPSLVSLQGKAASTSDNMLPRLRTTKGMEAALDRLAPEDKDHPRRRAVNPIWFWKKSSDLARYAAIFDTLSNLDKRL
ncbi:uncharacterized protein Triagg1_1501 [Trichoderma aggressivum f. europaeum]|uniref:Peptidase S8/S53 domain-containing protein n=1 Tax=Trichoderma aggressivum f. europaeum TaxID=173218 RepID=A0AAE1JH32_9HYPO|nr:hypothetical protein Triagg1_1501 [Trichoderma aggressivum f. europaeum]